MMDFISIPVVVGIVTLGIYKLFELFVHRKERLKVIEKIGDKIDPSFFQGSFSSTPIKIGNLSTGALKTGCLLFGVGLGLLAGFFIFRSIHPNITEMFHERGYREIASIVFGSSVLLFGGLGLLVAFFVEMRFNKEKNN